MSKTKRFLSMLLVVCMLLGLFPSAAYAASSTHSFTDVNEADWFSDAVQYVYENGLMNGTDTTIFDPQSTITRGQIVTILHRLEGTPSSTGASFTDVPNGEYYANAVAWSSANGIMSGYGSGLFGPADPITREQMATTMYRYTQYKGYDTTITGNVATFSDGGTVSSYAIDAVNWGIGVGLFNGVGDNMFDPTGSSTRAQAAMVLMRFCENIIPSGEDTTPEEGTTPGGETTPTVESHTVTFDYNYDSKGTYDTVTVEHGKTVASPTNPSRSGYSFNGWYTKTSGGSKYDFNTAVTSDLTLYAHWSSNSTSGGGSYGGGGYIPPSTTYYTVTFYMNDGTNDVHTSTTVAAGNSVSAPAQPTRSGYSFDGWYTDATTTLVYNFSSVVTGNLNLYAKWVRDIPPDTRKYMVDFVMTLDEQFIDDPTPYVDVQVFAGDTVREPVAPTSKVANFEGWYTGLDANEEYDFSQVINKDTRIFAKWSLITTDTDGEGIYDPIEAELGTDPLKADTDGDRLSDYDEVLIGTNPLAIDTDGDGISDYDEDIDLDGLSNGDEIVKGTDPTNADSDYDGLNDADELTVYGTDPLLEDTDGDGADDGWEVQNGFSPLIFNADFTVKSSSAPVTPENPVAAEVHVTLDGNQVSTLDVQRMEYSDTPLLSASIPGYMGSAYEFTVDGTFSDATLTFTYDSSLGVVGEDFQPRIYLLNEETGELDELPDQDVSGNTVTASVPHFSTYVLLNKVEFDKVWAEDINPPLGNGEDESSILDIMFVIDYSASMMDNDPAQIFKPLSKEFISKLRDGKDRAGIVKFIGRETLVSGLTTEKELLNDAIDSISYDDGYGSNSGTNGSAGIHMALEQLMTSASKYKYIVFITDGGDTRTSYSYDMLIETAINSGVTIYTIGMGNASESILWNLADTTGGKYYHATTDASIDDFIDLDDVFEDIENETVDLTTDSNGDGIPDYYAKLLYEGKLVLSNGSFEFSGIDFETSADYDGDGLLNGEEIVLCHRDGRTYLKFVSNPMLKHSDRDGIDDYTEVRNGTDPLKYTVSKGPAEALMDDDYYYAPGVSDDYHDGGFDKFIVDANAFLHIVWNKDELYRDAMIDYLTNYAKESYLDDVLFEATRSTMLNPLSTILSWFDGIKQYGTQYYEYYNNVLDLIDFINGTTNKADSILLYARYEEVIEQIAIIFPDNTILVHTKAIATSKVTAVNLTKLSNLVCDGISIAVGALDVVDTIESFSAVSANNEAFEQNLDLLNSIINDSVDENARNAARDIRNQLEKKYADAIEAIVFDVAENAIPLIAEKIMMKNPYTAAIVVVRAGVDLITGISEDLRQQFQMFSYTEMARGASNLFKAAVSVSGSYYQAKTGGVDTDEMLKRYLTHIAQTRVLAEKKYCDWQEDGGIIGWFTDNSDVEEAVDEAVDRIIQRVERLNLNLHPKILAMGD